MVCDVRLVYATGMKMYFVKQVRTSQIIYICISLITYHITAYYAPYFWYIECNNTYTATTY